MEQGRLNYRIVRWLLMVWLLATVLVLTACECSTTSPPKTTTSPTTTTTTTLPTTTTTLPTTTPITTSPTTSTEETTPPRPGEWTAQTGSTEFTFTFTVNPDSTGIPEYSYDFREFKCEGVEISGGYEVRVEPMLPITGGQFTIIAKEYNQYGPDWDIVIQVKFDETGTHASGTWQISAGETTCSSGTWTSTWE